MAHLWGAKRNQTTKTPPIKNQLIWLFSDRRLTAPLDFNGSAATGQDSEENSCVSLRVYTVESTTAFNGTCDQYENSFADSSCCTAGECFAAAWDEEEDEPREDFCPNGLLLEEDCSIHPDGFVLEPSLMPGSREGFGIIQLWPPLDATYDGLRTDAIMIRLDPQRYPTTSRAKKAIRKGTLLRLEQVHGESESSGFTVLKTTTVPPQPHDDNEVWGREL